MKSPSLLQIEREWTALIESPEFDAGALMAIRERYAATKARQATYEAIYEEQRAIVAEERTAAYEAAWEAHAQMSKGELIAVAGAWTTQRTKRELLEQIASAAASKVENEHSRVERIWRERQVEIE